MHLPFRSGLIVLPLQCLLALLVPAPWAFAQVPTQSRVVGPVDTGRLKRIASSTHPLATPAHDVGRVEPDLAMDHMIVVLSRSDGQNADLQGLIAAQKKAASPAYHLGLTPEQFAARFGPSDGDLRQIKTWLTLGGFRIDAVARGHGQVGLKLLVQILVAPLAPQ